MRRKTKVSPVTSKTKWWFVVHADEGLLSELNTKWDLAELQTSWKLEPCFMFASADGTTQLVPSPASQSQDSAQQVVTMRALLEMNERLTCQHIL